MANNEYVNKVVYGNQTLIDITDTTAEEGSVLQGQVFYKASGARSVGTALTGDINVIESITMNGSSVAPDANKKVALTESDPTVPSWAKQSTKPTYTAEEVGALPYPYEFAQVNLDASDNGIQTATSKTIEISDVNGRTVGEVQSKANPDGSTEFGFYTFNRRNGNNYGVGIYVKQAKDGTTTYNINEPYAFRDSISVYSKTEIDAMVATLAETKSYLGIS